MTTANPPSLAQSAAHAKSSLTRCRATLEGIVRGVGLEACVSQLAAEYGLAGGARGEKRSMLLELEGPGRDIEFFFEALTAAKPPLAHISRLSREELAPAGLKGFELAPEAALAAEPDSPAPPDLALCPQCLNELHDPENRRHGHPFISCNECGPRHTITSLPPYDRPNSTMANFVMCPECAREYGQPGSRRYLDHAIACPSCGPRLHLMDPKGRELSGDPVALAAELLRQGNILALKSLGGFQLLANARDQEAVLSLRRRKEREERPFYVMVSGLEQARGLVELNRAAESLLCSSAGPAVLASLREDHGLAPALSQGLNQVGVMLAYTPLHHLLLDQGPEALAIAPGNLANEPVCKQRQAALTRLGQVADFFLLHNRKIFTRADDSLAMTALGRPRLIRRSRGYVPAPLHLAQKGPDVLALGPELKCTVCLAKGDEAYLSPNIGDLKDAETLDYFLGVVERLQKHLQFEPRAVAVDLHPDYISTRQAIQFSGLPMVRVQHHAAHALSAMAERSLGGPALALVLDGNGYGLDGSIWGCELLRVGPGGMRRVGRLTPAMLPGGERAGMDLWRSALGRLYTCFGQDWQNRVPGQLGAFMRQKLDPHTLQLLQRMLRGGQNSPNCSSLSHLLNAAAALSGLRQVAAYEEQAAMELESLVRPGLNQAYPMEIKANVGADGPGLMDLDPRPMLEALLTDLQDGAPLDLISSRLHNGLINGLAQGAAWAAHSCGLQDIVLSGGCFCNRILLEGISRKLTGRGFRAHSQSEAPCNDGGISLGQALAARLALAAGDLELWTKETPDS